MVTAEQHGVLNAELERACVRAIARVYDDLNASLFGGQLRRPQLRLTESRTALGAWRHIGRTIELGREVLTMHDWGTLVEILKHEMAHQFVDEVLGTTDESAHGAKFRAVCRARAIDARASGVPNTVVDGRGAQLLTTVAKLLALAESADEHEARSAMSVAHRLMLKHNLDAQQLAEPRLYAFRHLGKPTGRVTESQRLLAGIVGDFFFVEAIWVPVWRPLEGKAGSVLEICGTDENLEIAAYAHQFLSRTAERLWTEYKTERQIAGNAARRTFIAGVMAGFREKLETDKSRNSEEGLVWVGDAALTSFLRARHPRVRWTSHRVSPQSEEFQAGRDRGRKIVLARAIRASASGSPPRALKGR